MEHKAKKKNKLNKKRILIILIFIIIAIIIYTIKSNKILKKENLSLIIDNIDITQKLDNEIIIKDNVVYISYDDIKKIIDEDIYMEKNKIIMSSSQKIASLELDSSELEINDAKKQIKGKAFKQENNIIYMPLSDLKTVYNMEFMYNEEYKNIVIDYYTKKLEKAYVRKTVLIKQEKDRFSPNVDKVKKANWVVYVGEEDGWAKVRTQNGNLGYVKKNKLTNFVTERDDWVEEAKESKDDALEFNISNKNISNYENRKSVIQDILLEAVKKQKETIKIKYKKNQESEEFTRFKTEATAVLKECAITIIF